MVILHSFVGWVQRSETHQIFKERSGLRKLPRSQQAIDVTFGYIVIIVRPIANLKIKI